MAATAADDPSAATPRPPFQPVDTNFDAPRGGRDDVESPSLSNSNALARFEFEPGRSKDGTKVLMVEWQEDAASRAVRDADWEISWDDKRAAVLPAKDAQQQQQKETNGAAAAAASPSQPPDVEPVNRMYFLLLPGMPVPTTVRLRKGATIAWRTNPLPAIFAPELGATARAAGKKGVLHTHWAKKRLQVLQAEIAAEAAAGNAEGIGLEIARAEREWIEQNFGVVARPAAPAAAGAAAGGAPAALHSPTSPRSPGGGRLMDKLKGLKLGTSAHALQHAPDGGGPPNLGPSQNPLSPEVSDVAVGGPEGTFASFLELKGARPTGELGAKPAQPPPPTTAAAGGGQRQFEAVLPPQGFGLGLSSPDLPRQQQGGMASMDALFTEVPFRNPAAAAPTTSATKDDDDEEEDDLFALPMSPRSPEMAKSPFSFAAQDVSRYVKGEKA